jgi:hypothetical protein
LPKDLEDFSKDLDKAETPNPLFENFKLELQDIRSEQKEILKEYYDLRIQIEKNVDIIDQKDLHSLKDDV